MSLLLGYGQKAVLFAAVFTLLVETITTKKESSPSMTMPCKDEHDHDMDHPAILGPSLSFYAHKKDKGEDILVKGILVHVPALGIHVNRTENRVWSTRRRAERS